MKNIIPDYRLDMVGETLSLSGRGHSGGDALPAKRRDPGSSQRLSAVDQ